MHFQSHAKGTLCISNFQSHNFDFNYKLCFEIILPKICWPIVLQKGIIMIQSDSLYNFKYFHIQYYLKTLCKGGEQNKNDL